MTFDLAVIILNYRTPGMTIECLESIALQIESLALARAVVVDNNSEDDSADKIAKTISDREWKWVELVRSPINDGFSAGNNIGLQHIDAKAYILMNSDSLAQPNAIAELLGASNRYPEAGIIGPRLLLDDGSLHDSCYRLFTPISEMLYSASTSILSNLFRRYVTTLPHIDDPSDVEWTSFACVLIRRETILDVGLMDEGYFMYFEDQDYCRRALLAGWKVMNWPAAKVIHRQGKSSPVRQLIAKRKRPPRYYYESRSRYFAKFSGRLGLWTANTLWTIGRVILFVRTLLGRKESHICEWATLDIWTNAWDPVKQVPISPKSP